VDEPSLVLATYRDFKQGVELSWVYLVGVLTVAADDVGGGHVDQRHLAVREGQRHDVAWHVGKVKRAKRRSSGYAEGRVAGGDSCRKAEKDV